MEFISTLCAILFLLCVIVTPITFLAWIILLVKKSEKRNKAKRNFLISLCGIVLFTAIGVVTVEECEHSWENAVQIPASCNEDGSITKVCTLCSLEEIESVPAFGHTFTEQVVRTATYSAAGLINKTCSVCGDTQSVEIPQMGTKENPGEVTVSELVAEINANIDAAKSKYNGKWIKITGKVLDADNVAGMTRFYLYGEYAGSGLKIICWVNEQVLKPFDYAGETHVFIGQVREITIMNATESGDCTIVS